MDRGDAYRVRDPKKSKLFDLWSSKVDFAKGVVLGRLICQWVRTIWTLEINFYKDFHETNKGVYNF